MPVAWLTATNGSTLIATAVAFSPRTRLGKERPKGIAIGDWRPPRRPPLLHEIPRAADTISSNNFAAATLGTGEQRMHADAPPAWQLVVWQTDPQVFPRARRGRCRGPYAGHSFGIILWSEMTDDLATEHSLGFCECQGTKSCSRHRRSDRSTPPTDLPPFASAGPGMFPASQPPLGDRVLKSHVRRGAPKTTVSTRKAHSRVAVLTTRAELSSSSHFAGHRSFITDEDWLAQSAAQGLRVNHTLRTVDTLFSATSAVVVLLHRTFGRSVGWPRLNKCPCRAVGAGDLDRCSPVRASSLATSSSASFEACPVMCTDWTSIASAWAAI